MKLMVVQPYIAEYRRAFWEQTFVSFAQEGIELTLAAGAAGPGQSARQDQVQLAYQLTTPSKSISLFGRQLRWQSAWRQWQGFDALVLEASGSLVDTSVALFGTRPVGLWGHLSSYVNAPSRLDAIIERRQLARASVILAYTDRGASVAIAEGIPRSRVTSLLNTVDTSKVLAQRQRLSRDEASAILSVGDRSPSTKFVCFVGGVDGPKRIDFLAQALEQLWKLEPKIVLLLGGQGTDASLLDAAVQRGQVVMLGRVNDLQKAAMGLVSEAMLMPGRVGLVAVDSFSMGTPIFTTDWPFHAPEFDYLEPGIDSMVARNSVDDYTNMVVSMLASPGRMNEMSEACMAKVELYSIQEMSRRFVQGCAPLFN